MRLWILIMLILMSSMVFANQPNIETSCCLSFNDGFSLPDRCQEFEINKERCDVIVKQWKRTTDMMDSPILNIFLPLLILGVFIAIIAGIIWLIVKKLRKHR